MEKKNTFKTALKRLTTKKNPLTVAMVAVLYAVIAYLVYSGSASRQLSNMLISVSCYIVLAVSLNLVVGLLGELSLGHASFMSVGLFTGCQLALTLHNAIPGMPFWVRLPLAMLFGGIMAAAVGFVVGLPALRLKGDYLAIVTLACGEIIKSIITNLKIFGGALGLSTGPIYSNTKTLLPYAIVLVFLTMLLMMNLKKSRYGRAIMAVRDNRIAAESCGVNVTYFKLVVFMIAAFFAGAAGALYGHNFANIKATTFDYNMSIEILVIVVLGGMGSVRGSIIAAIVLRALPEMLREFSDYRMLVYSIVLIAIMLLNASPRFNELRGRLTVKNIIAVLKKKKTPVEETVEVTAGGEK
ncbi:MAG: branched-chain amino acid ABC transporter permease [Oscillospiraceae bacterium]|nr:branched-chain amino acid ABC transporter permease [Oscillospiraceae bacterium]